MNKKNILIKVLPIMAILFFSCDDKKFLEVKAPAPTLETVNSIEQLVVGSYYIMTGNGGNKGTFDALALTEAGMSEYATFIPTGGPYTGANDLYLRNSSVENAIPTGAWEACYQVIQDANLGLDIIDSKILDNAVNSERLPQLKGEFLFTRSYAYYILLKLFCPMYVKGSANDTRVIPYAFTRVTGAADANIPAGETGKIYQKLIDDLALAKTLLKPVSLVTVGSVTSGRVNVYAAAALSARINLQMNNFDEAAADCSLVINSGLYDLSERPIEAWNKPFEGTSRETIWSYTMGKSPNENGLGGSAGNKAWKVPRRYSAFNYSQTGAGDPGNGLAGSVSVPQRDHVFAISMFKLNQIGWITPGDSLPTNKAKQDKRYQDIYRYIPTKPTNYAALIRRMYYVDKYYRSVGVNKIGPIPLFRLAEMYLTRSIARFKSATQDLTGAASDLNVVRKRAWDDVAAGTPYVDLTSADITENLINEERWKELSHEGDWVYYLQALKINIPNGDRGDGELNYNDQAFYWPIPATERQSNQSLNQKL